MSFQLWLLYLIAVIGVISSPGPNALYCASVGMNRGWRSSLYAAIGGNIVVVFYMILVFTGLTYINSNPGLMSFFKCIAGLYLIYLALDNRKWEFSKIKLNQDSPIDNIPIAMKSAIIGLSNPKDIAFLLALFPSFINPDTYTLFDYSLLVLTWSVVEIIIMTGYGVLGENVVKVLSPKIQDRLNRVVTGIFLLLGVLLIIGV